MYPQKDIPLLMTVLKETDKGMHNSANDASTLFSVLTITSIGFSLVWDIDFTHKGDQKVQFLAP